MFLLSRFSYTPPKKCQTRFIFISVGILDQISITFCFIILAPEFQRAFGKANCKANREKYLLMGVGIEYTVV